MDFLCLGSPPVTNGVEFATSRGCRLARLGESPPAYGTIAAPIEHEEVDLGVLLALL